MRETRGQLPMEVNDIRRAVEVLKRGALVIIPTDTVYGVAADAALPGAVDRIYAAKRRDEGKPVPLLAASIDAIRGYGGILGPVAAELAKRFWPGPLTIVLRTDGGDGRSDEGFRIPAHEQALDLLRAVGGVLRVSSANESGCAPALTAADAEKALGQHVEFVLDAGPAPGGTASTVVRVEGPDAFGRTEIVVLREGAVSCLDLADVAPVRREACPNG